jgi:hypothetical protein
MFSTYFPNFSQNSAKDSPHHILNCQRMINFPKMFHFVDGEIPIFDATESRWFNWEHASFLSPFTDASTSMDNIHRLSINGSIDFHILG